MKQRIVLERLGNKLVDQTEAIVQGLNPFLIRFNSEFNYLHLPEFVFANAHYI
jgi:hypothetical protein